MTASASDIANDVTVVDANDDPQPPVDQRLVIAIVALIAIVLVWLLYRLLTSDWLPIGDYRTLQPRSSGERF